MCCIVYFLFVYRFLLSFLRVAKWNSLPRICGVFGISDTLLAFCLASYRRRSPTRNPSRSILQSEEHWVQTNWVHYFDYHSNFCLDSHSVDIYKYTLAQSGVFIVTLHKLLHFLWLRAIGFIYLDRSSHRQSYSHTPITLNANIKQDEVNTTQHFFF